MARLNFFIFMLLACPAAEAAIRSCTLSLGNVTVDKLGYVYLNGFEKTNNTRFEWQNICNVSTPSAGVTVEACRTWSATAMTALATDKNVFIFFDDTDNAGRTTCVSLPGWNNFSITYLGIDK